MRRSLHARPDYGWLSEETPDDLARLATRRVWIADPIDGTRDFIAGGDRLVHGGGTSRRRQADPRRSSACPARDEFFIAWRGDGAMRNDVRLKHGRRLRLDGATIVANRSVLARLGKTQSAARRSLPLSSDCAGSPRARWMRRRRRRRSMTGIWRRAIFMVREAGGIVSTARRPRFSLQSPRDAAGRAHRRAVALASRHCRGIEDHMSTKDKPDKQLLHLVFGGELPILDAITFKDVTKLDIVGIYPNYRRRRRRPGSARRARPSTMRRCAISSCICIACSIRRARRRRRSRRQAAFSLHPGARRGRRGRSVRSHQTPRVTEVCEAMSSG